MRKRVDPGGVHRESDGFWSKVLVATIVVIWVSLVAGQWAGKWAIEHGKFAAKDGGAHQEYDNASRPAVHPPPPESVPSAVESAPAAVQSPSDATPDIPAGTPSDSPSEASPTAEATSPATPDEATSTTPDASVTPEASASNEPVKPPSAAPSDHDKHPVSLQMGVFANRSNAEKLADDLRGKGYTVDVVPEASGSNSTWVVRVGHFNDRAAADAAQQKLQGDGYHSLPVSR